MNTEYHASASIQRLDFIAQKITEDIGQIDVESSYGGDKVGQAGGTVIAALARAAVAVEKELREAIKAATPKEENLRNVIQMAPRIPTNLNNDEGA